MAATHEEIGAVIRDPRWTESEKWVVKWQFHYLGDFEEALARAMCLADGSNLDLLARVFPTQVDGYRLWTQGDLGERLREKGLDI